MKQIIVAAALAALVTQPTLARAQESSGATTEAFNLTAPSPGYTYFYRAGATMAAHDSAVRDCGRQAARMVQPQDGSAAAAGAAGGLLGALVVGVVSGYIQGKRNTRALGANLENCMVIEGWGVRSVDAVEGEALDKLAQPALHDALALRVEAAEPIDEQVRVFGNELKRQPPAAFGWAGDMDSLSLSLQALPPADKEEAAPPRPRLPRQPRSARPVRALAETQLSVAPETGLVIMNLKGQAEQGGRSLTFVRMGDDPETPAWVADQRPDRFVATLTGRAATRGDTARQNTVAFAVPPGRWRLAAVTHNLFSLSLCRGAPAFDVRAGEAVFAGTFDMNSGVAMPRTAVSQGELPPAYAALSPTPAVWTDGGVGMCEGAYLYGAFRADPAAPVVSSAEAEAATAPAEPAPTTVETETAVVASPA